jgi:hypothetical protein
VIELPKSLRVFTPKQSRMLRRLARKALEPMAPRLREAMQPLGDLALSQLAGLPATTFRCDLCGRREYIYEPEVAGRSFAARHAPKAKMAYLECPEHGDLQTFTVADWHAEWERRGRPAHLNWRRRPLS